MMCQCYSLIWKNPPDGTQTYHGSEVTLFKALAGHFNFDYIIREPQLRGGFKGMLAEMLMGLSDVGWSQLYFNEWRWQHFDLTTSYDEDQACLMVNIFIFIIALDIKMHCKSWNFSIANLVICHLWLFYTYHSRLSFGLQWLALFL